MTYDDLLEKTTIRKAEMVEKYNSEQSFRLVVDIDHSKAASYLALPFLDELSNNISEIYESAGDDLEKTMIFDIYSKYYDGIIEYDDLPVEAQLFG